MASYENVKGIRIEIGGDATPLYTALNEASQKTKELESQLVDLNKNLKLDPKNVELVQKKFDTLSQLVATSEEKVKLLKKGLQDAQLKFKNGEITEEQLKKITSDLEKATKETKYWKSELTKFEGAEGQLIKVASDMKEISEKQKDLKKTFVEYTDELSRTDFQKQPEKWQEINKKIEENRQEQEETRKEAERLGGEFQNLVQQVAHGTSGMQTFSDATKTTGQNLKTTSDAEETFKRNAEDMAKSLEPSAIAFSLANQGLSLFKQLLSQAIKELVEYVKSLDTTSIKVKDLLKSSQDLRESIRKEDIAHQDEITTLDARLRSIEKTNNAIKDAKQRNQDYSKQVESLKLQVKQFNDAVGEEVLLIDKSTGELKQNGKELEKVRQNIIAYAKAQYYLNQVMAIVSKQMELQQQIEELGEPVGQQEVNRLRSLKKEYEDLGLQLDRNIDGYYEAIGTYTEYNDALGNTEQAVSQSADVFKEATDKMIESHRQALEKAEEYEKKRLEIILDTNKKINDKSEISLKDRVKIMKENADTILRYEENVAYLRRLLEETTDTELRGQLQSYLDYIDGDFSEENMQVVRDIVNDFKEGGGDTAKEFLSYFKKENLPEKMRTEGQKIDDGIAQGIKDNQSKVLNTASDLASKIAEKLKIKVGISASESAINFNPRRGAQGGIVTQPTTMLVGEMGSEVILPLDKLAGIITATMQQSGGAVGNYTMNVYPQSMSPSEQETLFEKFDARFGASTSRRNI